MCSTRGLAVQGVAQRLVAGGAFRGLAPLGVALLLGACATSSGAAFSVLPGPGKDQAAFQQDMLVCQQHAVAHTGYNAPVPTAAAGAAANPVDTVAPGGTQPFDATGYLQCMASRGDTVQAQPTAYAAGIYPDGYSYPYGYPYAYGYPTGYGLPGPFYDGGLYGGLGLGFGFGGGRFGHERFEHGRFEHGRFAHGGFDHDGFGHGGFLHGGFGHGGFGHGGFAHGGGGHR